MQALGTPCHSTDPAACPLGQIRGYKNDKFGSLDMCYAIDTKAPDMPTSCADAKLFALYKTIAK